VIQVNWTLLLDTLFCKEFIPIVSLCIGTGAGYGFPVKSPTGFFRLKHWTWVTLFRLNATTGVNHPATILFFQIGQSPKKKTDEGSI
jgi:hypothetical protein